MTIPRNSSLLNIRDVIKYCNKRITSFVPKHKPPNELDILKLQEFLAHHGRILLITGAGISTESGIPDYRSAGVGLYARSNSRPMKYQDFIKSDDFHKRYWARNFVGWPRFSSFEPNATHYAIRDLEYKHDKIIAVITQNVDRLHTKAGSKKVIEVHGTAFEIVCLNCNFKLNRQDFQKILCSSNPEMIQTSDFIRPDGDVELTEEQYQHFKVPKCMKCNVGILKPDIVFFGENVPRKRVENIQDKVNKCDSVLVLGSSLTVFSGFRIVLQASELKKPIAIVNIGETRADSYACLKIDAKCGDVLPSALKLLT